MSTKRLLIHVPTAPEAWVQLQMFPPELYGAPGMPGELPNTKSGYERAQRVLRERVKRDLIARGIKS